MTESAHRRMIVTPGSSLLKEQCPVMRQDFHIGEEAVICSACNTAYKVESWNFIGGRCVVCAGPQSAHVPPPPAEQRPVPQPLDSLPLTAVSKPGTKVEPGLAWLVGAGGRLYSMTKGDNNVGRAADNDLVVDDVSVSAHHARIRHGGGNTYYLYDLASTNGTTVNGQPITRTLLYDGDQVGFGRASFQYRQVDYRDQ